MATHTQETLISRCISYKHVILYGYTYISKELLEFLEVNNVDNIRFFCDGKTEKVGSRFHDIMCLSPGDLLPIITDEYLFVICSQKAYAEIEDSLISHGVQKKNIVRYLKKTGQYALEDADSKLVTVIIPAYNAEQYIDRCLESVWKQDYQKWECIIVNDGSKDHTEELVNKWVKKDCRFRLYNQKNKGVGVARNKAISVAEGQYVTFIDADDWVEPEYIKLMVRSLMRNNAQVCKCNFWFHDVAQNKVYEAGVSGEIDVLDEKTYIHPNLWANLYERSLFTMYDIIMPGIPLEDLAVYPLLLLKAKKVVGLDKPLYNYQINTGKSIMDNVRNVTYYPNAVEYLLREADRLGLKQRYSDLFKQIACRHMLGGLNSRIKSNCTLEEYQMIKRSWCSFLTRKFPSCGIYSGFHRIWAWGSYNLPCILANIRTYEGYNVRTTGLAYYFGYSSVISLMNKRVETDLPQIEDPFLNDMLEKEQGHCFYNIEPEEEDILIIDLLEERNDIIAFGEGGWLTHSEIWNKISGKEKSILKRDSAECQKLGRLACEKFSELILKKFKRHNIFLIESFYASKLKTLNNWTLRWEGIDEINEILRQNYTYLKTLIPEIKTLVIPKELNYTDAGAKYGITPAYLNSKVYELLAGQLEKAVIMQDSREME